MPTDDPLYTKLLRDARRMTLAPAARVHPDDRDDVAQQATIELCAAHRAGKVDLVTRAYEGLLFTVVRSRARDAHRARARRPSVSLDAPVGDDGETTLGDLVEGGRANPEDRVLVREALAALRAENERLKARLERSPRLALIDELVRAGVPHAEIADRLTVLDGKPASAAAVRRAISRLMNEFPKLRDRWERRAAAAAPVRRIPSPSERRARLSRVDAAAAARGPLVAAIAAERRQPSNQGDWQIIASSASKRLNRMITSTTAREAWRAFVDELEPALRRVA